MRKILSTAAFLILALTGCQVPKQSETVEIISPMQTISIIGKESMSMTETDALTFTWGQSSSPDVAINAIYQFANASDCTNGVPPINMFQFFACTSAVVNVVYSGSELYFAVSAIDLNGNESLVSNLCHWPPYEKVVTGYRLSGNGPVQSSSDLKTWSDFTNISTQNIDLPYDAKNKFFRGINPLTLKPILFDPN